jgi:hypothetical protein
MKKFLMSLMAIAIVTTCFTSCNPEEEKEQVDVLIEQGVLRGILKHEVTLDAGKTYSLAGALIIENGGSLTIPAGTKIIADEGFGNYILVAQGGKIFVNGTAEKPVKMSANIASPKAGAWGGLIINGYAPLTSSQQTATTEINADYVYGGSKANDNSGSVTYLILESTGARSSADIEHNGLTLNGVGNGTKVENVFVYECADDGIEFFGGSVNVTNLLVVNTDDDMFDFTQGYNGTLKNAYGVWEKGFSSTESDPRGIEADGNFDGKHSEDTHQSDFVVENMTIDLKLDFVDKDHKDFSKLAMQDVIKVRREAKATIKNALVKGTGAAIDLIDLTDGKTHGNPETVISLTNSLSNPFTGKQINGEAPKAKVEAGNTGCPTDIFKWTGYKF